MTHGWNAVRGLAPMLSLLLFVACKRSPDADVFQLEPPAPDSILDAFEPRARIPVQLLTDEGIVHCTLDGARAPRAVASFIGLATGRSAHRDLRNGSLSRAPLYEHLHFFRALPGAYVQTGCPLDDGTGHPGYRFAPEPQPDDAQRLGPGALFLASYTAPPHRQDPHPPPAGHTLGSQFAIALGNMQHLAGTTTVLGHCDDLGIVARIARAKTAGHASMLERVVIGDEPEKGTSAQTPRKSDTM